MKGRGFARGFWSVGVCGVVALALGALLWGMLLGMPAAPLAAQASCDRYVLGIDAGDHGDCSDEAHPCRTVPYAIAQAAPGDRICVAKHTLAGPLTYTGTLEITQSLTLDGAWDAMCVDPSDLTCSFWSIPCNPFNVTLDAEGAGRVISISGAITPVIDCFTITGGDAAGLGGSPTTSGGENDAGGGIYSRDAAPMIVNNVISGNYGCDLCPSAYGRGGGVYLLNAPATSVISNNLIVFNVADDSTWGQGGGLMLFDSDAQVLSNTIARNRAGLSAGDGGGIRVMGGQPTLADNMITQNAAGQAVMGNGGGIFAESDTPVTIARNRITNNRAINGTGDTIMASHGGGIYAAGAVLIYDNEIDNNLASPLEPQDGEGGGVYLRAVVTSSIVRNNVIHDNVGGHNDGGSGGGIHTYESVVSLEDNLIYGNAASWAGPLGMGGGVGIVGGQVTMARNVITGNRAVYFTGPPNEDAIGLGGGLYVTQALALVMNDNVIADNVAPTQGGGAYFTSLENALSRQDQFSLNRATEGGAACVVTASVAFAEAEVLSNTADSGGGFYVQNGSFMEVTDSWFAGNQATQGGGGGVNVFSGEALTFAGNYWLDNEADAYGGGLYAQAVTSSLRVNGDYFSRNQAPGGGSGAYFVFDGSVRFIGNTVYKNVGVGVEFHESDVRMDNNVVANQTMGVRATGGTARMRHNTIVSNKTGMALHGWWASDGVATLTNTILAGNTTGITVTEGETATLTGTLWGTGAWGNVQGWGGDGLIITGAVNVYDDPAFVDPATGDYHIQDTSAAIDAGVDTTLSYDIDGDPRPAGAGYDLGADEQHGLYIFLPLVLRQQ